MNVSDKQSKPIRDATGNTAKSVVSVADFKASLPSAAPPPDLDPPLAALWWAAKGQWDGAHRIVQDEDDKDSAWVHAYLHRVEGDLGNADYWYRRAGQPVAAGPLETEWERIVATLLQGGGRA